MVERNRFKITLWIKGCYLFLLLLFLIHPVCWAQTLALPDTAYQGDLIVGAAPPGARIRLKDQWLPKGPEGHFVIAVSRNQQKDLLVTAVRKGRKSFHTIRVWAYPWKKQHITGLAKQYVSPSAEKQRRIRMDAQKIRTVRNSVSYPLPLFIKKGFIKPVSGKVTGQFGSQRILNNIPRSSHSGIDIAAPLGKPVLSPADGIVRLTAENMFLMGNTLLLDHGLGVYSIFIHLNRIHVQVGDLIRQGDLIAEVGKTGRATGPHLHWGVSVGSVPVDPLRVLKKRFSVTHR
jgi:murein DD-endopeptidase MepM/ murein hydrolase activator NlpD